MEEEEVVCSAQVTVITPLGLLHTVLVLLQAVLVWEGDAIHALQAQARWVGWGQSSKAMQCKLQAVRRGNLSQGQQQCSIGHEAVLTCV